MVDREDMIRQRAYSIWEEEGHPHGRADDHWHRAALEMGTARADTGPATADAIPDIGEAPSLETTEAAPAEKPAPRRRKASTTAAAAAKPRKRTAKKS